MKKIEKLTDEQIARFPEFINRWTAIGLCTEAADRVNAEKAICELYKYANLKPPAKIVWCDSPLSQGLTRAILIDPASVGASVWNSVRDSVVDSVGASVWNSVWNSVRASVRDSVWNSVRASVKDSVWDSVGDSVGASVWNRVGTSVWNSVRDSVVDSVGASVWNSVWNSVRASVRDSVRNSVRDSVRDSVGASVGDSVGDSVGASVGASVGDSVWDSIYGAHDAEWLAFYAYFREACALEVQTQKLQGLAALAQNAGWALPHANICWVSERHNVLQRDERGRLHNLSGPAVMYPDGWAIYAINGVRVPVDVVENPASITGNRILTEANAEVRRVMIERLGYKSFLEQVSAREIDRDADPQWGILYEVPNVPVRFVKMRNCTQEPDGSYKEYVLAVERECTSAKEAIIRSWGLNRKEFDLLNSKFGFARS